MARLLMMTVLASALCYAIASSAGSCYSMSTHAVTCNVAQADCTGMWYAPGYTSSRSGCCHCAASCANRSDTCSYYDAQAGSCYSMTTHSVTCDVAESSCGGMWYEPGYTSSRSGCCHCSAGCSSTSASCTYYDAPATPATPAEPACIDSATVATWTAPINEPCYVHDAACIGYPVCCVTTGTCVSMHGGMVSSNAKYYEGGCISSASSTGTTMPGCGGMIGECNAHYLNGTMGATSEPNVSLPISSAVTARLVATTISGSTITPAPCVTWDTVEFKAMLAGEDISDYTGRRSRASSMCSVIASSAGVPSRYASCSATDVPATGRRLSTAPASLGVELSAVIQATGTGITAATVTASLALTMGTPELASAALSSSSYNISVTTVMTQTSDSTGAVTGGGNPSPPASPSPPPVVVVVASPPPAVVVASPSSPTLDDSTGSAQSSASDDGLSTGAIVGIAVGCGVLALLLVGLGYWKFCGSGKVATTAAKA